MVAKDPRGRLFAGAVEVDITPPVGVAMAGYGARTHNSIGIHDPLYARALYLKLDSRELLLITCDLIGVDLNFTSQLRQDISEALGISPDHIMVSCTHTHSGPQGFLPDEPVHVSLKDEGLREITRRKLLGAAKWAVSEAEPVSLSFYNLNLTGIGKNRNDPEEGPIDPQLSLLRVNKPTGEPYAVFYNYGCHPTVMGHQNLFISADLPGAASRALKSHYPDCVFIFTNGASGDVSTRFTRREQRFPEVNRLGNILASGVLQAMMKSEPLPVSEIGGERIMLDLLQRTFPPEEEIQATIMDLEKKIEKLRAQSAPHGEIRKVVTQLEGAKGQQVMVKTQIDPSFFSTELQFFHIGALFIAGIPGEPFSQTVLDIKADCFPKKTVVISYANDTKGYFPDQRSIENNTYEALISPYDRRVSDLIYQLTTDHCKES
jgi:hypothetical protein